MNPQYGLHSDLQPIGMVDCEINSFSSFLFTSASGHASLFLPKLCSDTCEALMDALDSPMTVAIGVKSLHVIVALLRRRDTRPYLIPLLRDMAFVARSMRKFEPIL